MAVCSLASVALCLGLVAGRAAQRRLHTRERRLIPSRETAPEWASDSESNVPPHDVPPLGKAEPR